MIRRLLAGAAVGLALIGRDAPPAAGAEVFADAEVGGGYDGNLNAATNTSESEDDGFGFATGGIGVATAARAPIRGELSARWEGVLYGEYSDLSFQRVTLAGALRARVSESITLRLSPRLGGSFYGDSDRDSFDLGIGVGARFAPGRGIHVDPGYTFMSRDAEVSEFDRTAHRFSLALGAEPWERGYLRATTTAELGQVVRYEQIAAGGGGGGGGPGQGRPNDTFGSNWIADREDATSAEIALSLEQGLSERIFVALGGAYVRVWADSSDYDVYTTNASLGVRWP